MAFSAITVRIRFQDSSGNLVYQGNGTSNLRLWGAVLELGAENTERALGSFATQYRYIRSLGAAGDALSSRYIFDARPDVVTIGIDDARRLQTGTGTGIPAEHTVFNYVKQAKRAGTADPVGSDSVTPSDSITVVKTP
jgi:hypothetical protein